MNREKLKRVQDTIRPTTDIGSSWRYALTDLIDALLEDDEPPRTGWFTAHIGDTPGVVRRELRSDGCTYDESCRVRLSPSASDEFVWPYDYTNIRWEDDEHM